MCPNMPPSQLDAIIYNNSRARDTEERKPMRGDKESTEHVCGGVSSPSLK